MAAVILACMCGTAHDGLAVSSVSAVEQLDFANGLFQRGFYDMAITEYRKFITLFPKDNYTPDAFFGIA
ncbi:MAG: hypothetical protein PHS37_07110, partial [Candidatus Omnitrophica bacterium]|nr:hypothetical protein [Candidatus Omnitrophota bacterium]